MSPLGWLDSLSEMEASFTSIYSCGRRPIIPLCGKCLTWHSLNKWHHGNHSAGGSGIRELGTSFLLILCFLCLYSSGLFMPFQGLPLSRMAPLGMLLGLLIASCFTFCFSHQNQVSTLSQEGSFLGPKKPLCHQGCCGSGVSFYVSYMNVASAESWSLCISFPLSLNPLTSV